LDVAFASKAENCVGGDDPGWKHGGNQRVAVSDARNIAIRQPRPIERCRTEMSPGAHAVDSKLHGLDGDTEWMEMFALDDWKTAGSEAGAVLCEIQLAA